MRISDWSSDVCSSDLAWWVQANRDQAEKEVEAGQKALEQKRNSVKRFHRYCVIGFYLAALSCLLVVLPVLVIGLLGRDAPTPASCCSLALIEGQGICTLAAQAQAQAQDKASPDVDRKSTRLNSSH